MRNWKKKKESRLTFCRRPPFWQIQELEGRPFQLRWIWYRRIFFQPKKTLTEKKKQQFLGPKKCLVKVLPKKSLSLEILNFGSCKMFINLVCSHVSLCHPKILPFFGSTILEMEKWNGHGRSFELCTQVACRHILADDFRQSIHLSLFYPRRWSMVIGGPRSRKQIARKVRLKMEIWPKTSPPTAIAGSLVGNIRQPAVDFHHIFSWLKPWALEVRPQDWNW